jgi:hypothetical protein
MRIKVGGKAQSLMEYIIIVVAIVTVIIIVAKQFIQPAVQQSINDTQTAIEKVADKI